MPAIASLEDLKAAQKDLLEAHKGSDSVVFTLYWRGVACDWGSHWHSHWHRHGLNERWRRIGWKNICKLWLEERTPEELKG